MAGTVARDQCDTSKQYNNTDTTTQHRLSRRHRCHYTGAMLTRVALRFSARSRLPNVLPRCNHAVPSPLVLPIRTYATPGRPKSVVGEPSRPVKRAVKKAASKPRDGTSAAEKKVAAKKRKRAAKRAVTPEEAAQKAVREAARKEKATERKAAIKKRTKLQDLKATALPDAPKKTAFPSAYLAYWAEAVKERKANQGVKERVKEAATEWKQKSAADIEVQGPPFLPLPHL